METRKLMDNCPNIHCSNKLGEGAFLMLSFPSLIEGDKPVQILMCRPCADIINHDLNRAARLHG